ncbi:MAG TPA: DNA primase [bacterium]|nr:DNA primase [bacterium]
MAGTKEITDEIRRRVNILEVVSQHVTVRRAGRSYKGLCPFHSEKTPSFTVDPERGFFYCFGCHVGGDVFDFVMRMETVTFAEARRDLADRAGVRIERASKDDSSQGERERLLRTVAEGAAFFQAQLKAPAGEPARRYLAGRRVDPEIQLAFRLGFAPSGWDNLIRALHGRGFDAAVLELAGLAVARPGGDGYYDALRDRLIFPIHDLQGRPVAFGGRVLDAGIPKYLNTRETALFTKGKTLYALGEAREAIRVTGEAVVVEGYMDALACHQHGIRNAVASLGTALTLDQALLLKRFAARAILVYDADAAGVGASERGLEVFDQADLPVRVAVLPGESDPDAFLREEGPEAFRRLCAAALPVFDYKLTLASSRFDINTVEGKVGIVNEISQLIISVTHPVRQEEYVRLLANRLGVREEAIRGQLRRMGRSRPGGWEPRVPAAEQPTSDASGRAVTERELLHLLVASADARDSLRGVVTPEMFVEPAHRELAAALFAEEAAGTDGSVWLRERLRSETAISLLGRFLITEPSAGDPQRGAQACARRLRRFVLQERVDDLRVALERAERGGDQVRVGALQIELQELYRELKGSAQAS